MVYNFQFAKCCYHLYSKGTFTWHLWIIMFYKIAAVQQDVARADSVDVNTKFYPLWSSNYWMQYHLCSPYVRPSVCQSVRQQLLTKHLLWNYWAKFSKTSQEASLGYNKASKWQDNKASKWQDNKASKWQDNKASKWQDNKASKWQDNKASKWQDNKASKWQDNKASKWQDNKASQWQDNKSSTWQSNKASKW